MSYGTLADLTNVGLPATALTNVPSGTQQASLDAMSSRMDDYFGGRYSMPLLSWPFSLNYCCAVMAAYDLMVVRGYNPSAGADVNFRDRYEDQIRWLEQVQRQCAHPAVVQSPSSTNYAAPQVISSSVVSVVSGCRRPTRGW
jgi:phage gp36-like protein